MGSMGCCTRFFTYLLLMVTSGTFLWGLGVAGVGTYWWVRGAPSLAVGLTTGHLAVAAGGLAALVSLLGVWGTLCEKPGPLKAGIFFVHLPCNANKALAGNLS